MDPLAQAALAALPILTILILMVGFGWPAARAGLAGLAVTIAVAMTAFGYGTTPTTPDAVRALAGPLLEATFTTATILWIVWPALAIYHLQSRTGSFDVLQHGIARLTDDPRIVALLVAWFLALFLEGAAGFGTPVALAAPFLVGAGFRPADAVAMALIGHAAAVSFGAIGTPVVPQVSASGLTPLEIARATAPYHALLGWMLPLFLIAIAARRRPGRSDSSPGHKAPGLHATGAIRAWPWALLAAGLFLLAQLALAWWIGPELPALGGALAGGLAFAFIWWRAASGRDRDAGAWTPVNVAETLRAAAPYLIVVGLILVTRLVEPLRDLLQGTAWEWRAWDRFTGSVQPLYHPGTALLLALFPAALVQRATARDLAAALARAGRQILPVSIALVAMLGISRLLVHAGMIDTLARTAVDLAGAAWPFFIPLVGQLGSFVTGSATASNILFTNLQVTAAGEAGIPVAGALGAQGFGAAAGNMIAPHNVIAGAAAVAAVGQEGAILRRTLLPSLLYAALGGVAAWVALAR